MNGKNYVKGDGGYMASIGETWSLFSVSSALMFM